MENFAQLIRSDKEVVARVTPLKHLPADGDFNVGQGGCTDGKDFYIVLENQRVEAEGGYQANSHYSKIFKLDGETYEVVAVSQPLLIDHGNDVTYNSKLGLLVVSHNAPNLNSLSYVDPQTLELVKTMPDMEVPMYGIAYHAPTDRYLAGISLCYDMAILDQDLKLLQRFDGVDTGYVKQGIDCDDDFLYFLQFRKNCIVIYDWDGHYIRTVDIENLAEESEAMYRKDGQWYLNSYVSRGQGSRLYSLDFVEK